MGTHPIFESDFDCLTGMFKLLVLPLSLAYGHGLSCSDADVKTYVKLTADEQNSNQWSSEEMDLLSNVITYSVNKYNEEVDDDIENFEVQFGDPTSRISFCTTLVKPGLETPIDAAGDVLRKSIYRYKDTIYGAFPQFGEDILVFEGVPKTYELDDNDGLDKWYIPFFVVLGLVLIGVGVGLFLSLRSTSPIEDDTTSLVSQRSVQQEMSDIRKRSVSTHSSVRETTGESL